MLTELGGYNNARISDLPGKSVYFGFRRCEILGTFVVDGMEGGLWDLPKIGFI
jgi:hypothetical protein